MSCFVTDYLTDYVYCVKMLFVNLDVYMLLAIHLDKWTSGQNIVQIYLKKVK
ncbi:hypothetical protein SDC9_180508 [bioreactor metagenome]|uniref:Uncharacterized protein n=1 Tax=bioreactor metagenome TaxID=1076179 RepID=A0A645H1X5_9ZZZZ